jgi:hypothetical protein
VVGGVVAVGAFWRFGIQEAIGIRIAIIVLAAVALDLLVHRPGPAESTEPDVVATPGRVM